MPYVALKLGEKNLDQKLTFTTELAAALNQHLATYPAPAPTPTELTAKVKEIETLRTDLATATTLVNTLTLALGAKESELDGMLTTEAGYIQETSKGSEEKIMRLGLAVKTHRGGATAPGEVAGFKLLPGKNAGEVRSNCKPAVGAKGYEYQMALDPMKPETWRFHGLSTGSRTTLEGFASGTRVWLRMRAVGGKKTGKGPWCTPLPILVP